MFDFIYLCKHTHKKHIDADTKVKCPKLVLNYFMYETNIKLYFSAENKPENGNSDSEDSGYGKCKRALFIISDLLYRT